MKRKMIGALVGALCCSATLSLDVAHAAPKKKAKAAAAQEAPQSAGISDAMGNLHWGMTRDEVLGTFVEGIKEKYRPLIAKTKGNAIEEDKLRNKAREELSKIKTSIVDFNGKKTGWDVSFLKGEFSHNNNESMFVVTDDASQNYYFFINNKLWKWYKAFNSQAFQGKSFDQFASAIQGRYGKAVVKQGEGKQKFLAWQDPASSLRAVDNNQFYGFYCLVFESKETLNRLSDLRPNKGNDGNKAHALVESATDATEESDNNPDIIDRITGKMRVRTNAPEQSAQAPSGTSSKKAPSASAAPSSPGAVEGGGVLADDDPLKGLGI